MTPADIERVFGRSRLRMVTGEHVEVFREESKPGERRRYTKRFLATPAGDFSEWTEREWRILARLVGHGIRPVPDVVQFDRGAAGRPALVQTYDAGITVDHWATLLPLKRDGRVLHNVFEDCAHWWALARHCLVALDAIHDLQLVHLDLKADNICIPAGAANFDPGDAEQPLFPRFEEIALIDFAFSLVSGETLESPLPIAHQVEYVYQSPRLLQALEAGRHGDLRPTQQLDWRCDLFSLAAMLWRYLPELEDAKPGMWTPRRHAKARALVRRIMEAHDAELPAQRPHAELIEFASERLADAELTASLRRGWTLALDQPVAGGDSPTPVTQIAPVPVVVAAAGAAGAAAAAPARVEPAFDAGAPKVGRVENPGTAAQVEPAVTKLVPPTPLTPVTPLMKPVAAQVEPAAVKIEPVAAKVEPVPAKVEPVPAKVEPVRADAAKVEPLVAADRSEGEERDLDRRQRQRERSRHVAWAAGLAVATVTAVGVALVAPTWLADAGSKTAAADGPPTSIAAVALPPPRNASPPVVAAPALPVATAPRTDGNAASPAPAQGAGTTGATGATGQAGAAVGPGQAAIQAAEVAPAHAGGRPSAAAEVGPVPATRPEPGAPEARPTAGAKPTTGGRATGAPTAAPAAPRVAATGQAGSAARTPPGGRPGADTAPAGRHAQAKPPTRADARSHAQASSQGQAKSPVNAQAQAPAPAKAQAPAQAKAQAAAQAKAQAQAEARAPALARARPAPRAFGDGALLPRPDTVVAARPPAAAATATGPAAAGPAAPPRQVAGAGARPAPTAAAPSPPPLPGPAPRGPEAFPAAAAMSESVPAARGAPPRESEPVPIATLPRAPGAASPPSAGAEPTPRGTTSSLDFGARADEVLGRHVPRLAQRAERQVSRVLFIAGRAEPASDDEVVDAAAALARLPADPLGGMVLAPHDGRVLGDAGQAELLQRGRAGEALRLQSMAFGANPLDAELAGNLAFTLLRQRPAQAETARQLALHALTLPDARPPRARVRDWTTLAVASALAGRERDARNAWLVTLALSPNVGRQCKAAIDAYAAWGDRLRGPVEAMLQRASESGRSAQSPFCEWPAHWVTSTAGR